MSKRGKPKRKGMRMQAVNPNAAGIDIGSEVHYVAVPPDRASEPVRSFKCFTADLNCLADWLEECRMLVFSENGTLCDEKTSYRLT